MKVKLNSDCKLCRKKNYNVNRNRLNIYQKGNTFNKTKKKSMNIIENIKNNGNKQMLKIVWKKTRCR